MDADVAGAEGGGTVVRGEESRGVPTERGESRGEARGDPRGDTRGDDLGDAARSGCRRMDDTEPPCLIVSAGL